MNKKQWLGLGLVAVAAIGLAACGNRASKILVVWMINHSTNLLGKVCKLGGKQTDFQKGMDLITSNHKTSLNMRQTLMKLFLTTIN